ncbi:MAG: helix-turn-helix transcriptional regulator [Halothiobacillus sp.]|nr:helix-turn-helix transcriptional regulator [Halothiobacillus sp.]
MTVKIPAPLPSEMHVYFMSDEEVLSAMGERAKSHRLALNVTQDDLAIHAGVSRSCVRSFERGDSIGTGNMARILRSLRLLQQFVDAIPPVKVDMYKRISMREPTRYRASKPRSRK